MNTNFSQNSSCLNEYQNKWYDMKIPLFFSSYRFDTADAAMVTGEEIIFATVYKILNCDIPPEEIVMPNMNNYLVSLQTIIDRHKAKFDSEEVKDAISYVGFLTTVYAELLKCGVKTVPFDSKEVVYKRFVENVLQFKSIIEAIPEEELRSQLIEFNSKINSSVRNTTDN